MEYLYHLDKLYPIGENLIDVEYDTEICYDVEPDEPSQLGVYIQGKNAKSWTFSVRGREGRFRTHYNWALVLNTEDNVRRLSDIKSVQEHIRREQQRVQRMWLNVQTPANP